MSFPEYETPQSQVAAQAGQFADVATYLYERMDEVKAAVPSVLMEASFAIELFLKSLNSKNVAYTRPGLPGVQITAEALSHEHDLVKLYDEMAEYLRECLEKEFVEAGGRGTFREAIAPYKDLFVTSRYSFEEKDWKGNSITELIDLMQFLQHFVESMKRHYRDKGMKLEAATFAKWKTWTERIHKDITMRLVYPRQVFRGFNEMAIANSDHFVKNDGRIFFDFVAQGYINHIAIAIRKHAKNDKTLSFTHLLHEIKRCAPHFTYETYLEQFPIDPGYVNWQEGTFKEFSDDGKVVSVPKIEADIDELKRLTSSIVTMCDKEIAHLDKKSSNKTFTFGDLEACVDKFNLLACKYFKLVNKDLSGFSSLEPSILFNWQDIFKVPMDLKNTTWKDMEPFEDG